MNTGAVATLGVLVRLHVPDRAAILDRLVQIDGVTSFSVEEDERVGLVIEGATLEEARGILSTEVDRLPGVLGTWPVFAHCDPEEGAARESAVQSVESIQAKLQGAGDEEHTP